MRVLVTGAAGFIGSAVAARLRSAGHDVVGLDAYIPQAHQGDQPDPGELDAGDVRRADLRDDEGLVGLLAGVDVVSHQAAMVGVEAGAKDLPLLAGHNDLGTANLLAAMAEAGVTRLVLASSMVVYGDGRYVCERHGSRRPSPRTSAALDAGRFDMTCPDCGDAMGFDLVDESARLEPRSGYAVSKVAQEHYAAAWARHTRGSVIALRYHNVYGAGMPADTSYCGVAAMFRSSLDRGEAPRVFEDGGQMRDFVHVSDVADVNRRAVERVGSLGPEGSLEPFNVCSGRPVSILEVARALVAGHGRPGIEPVVTGEYRIGDVRHIVASPARAANVLGWQAATGPEAGLPHLAAEPLRGR